ncbi:MAG: DUF2384 domain-containing protein [Proteobacteria bacterium]|nr:DUF2384 domain-containing protein [Pseudomonadota bacterium]
MENALSSERKISQSVIQVTELLGMYQAELARILGLKCGDIGELASGRNTIKKDSHAWQQAALFIDAYNLLFDYFSGDAVAIYHWMRAPNQHLQGTPHWLIVDDGKLSLIRDYLSQALSESRGHPENG